MEELHCKCIMRRLNNKGQTGGLVSGLIFGIASLVIGIIIAFVVVTTLSDAGLLTAGRTTDSFINETGWINATATAYTLDGAAGTLFAPGTFVISVATNATSGVVIPAANYTVSARGVVTNVTGDFNFVNFTYTHQNLTVTEISEAALSDNFSKGVDNISAKIPTVLLIAAIILILGILAILVGVWARMRLGGSAEL